MSSISDLHAQRFHFGGSMAILASQVDGDNLKGFNKFGFNAGLLSGYSLNTSNWLVVELQYSTFGSKQRKEVSTMRLETEIRTLNVLCGYAVWFGDAWDGSKKFRLLIGPRMHAIQKASLGRNSERNVLDRYFISGNVSFGILLSESFVMDLSYNQGLSNILKAEYMGIESLNPYYLSFGITYYLYK